MESEGGNVLVSALLMYRSQAVLTLVSCFNAFSRVDIRVDVKIPGGVEAYVVDLRGERYVLIWSM
jgi:hypothetical protein